MTDLLPVGTVVEVSDSFDGRTDVFIAKVVGYDLFGTKYELGCRYAGWGEYKFASGGTWALPAQVRAVEEAAL